ncbi:MAG TPA: hypothetical protein VLZ55_08170 [Rhodanobacter sp.]|nr:hypothetical protein [Rhodanobacter sp.]
MTTRIARTVLPWLALVAIGSAAAWLRYGLIESSTLGQLCSEAGSPWWCSWRQALVLGFLHNVYGSAALVAALLAMVSRRGAVAWLASALGLFALVLYCFQSGAIALLIGSLRLLRAQVPPSAPPGLQDRPGKRDIQRQP